MGAPEIRGPWIGATPDLASYVREFVRDTRSPEGLRGLSFEKPANDLGFTALYYFDLRPGKGKKRPRIDCALCGTKNKFWIGHVFLFEDGFLRLIGDRICARHHLQVEKYEAEVYRLEQETNERRFINRMKRTLPFLDAAINELKRLIKHPALKERERLLMQFDSYYRVFRDSLVRAGARPDQQLSVYRRVRDKAQEAFRARSTDADDDSDDSSDDKEWAIWTEVPEYLGAISGTAFINHQIDIEADARQLLNELLAMRKLRDQFPGDYVPFARKKSRIDATIANLRTFISKASGTLRAAGSFFAPQNLKLIERWFNDPDQNTVRGRLKAVNRGLVLTHTLKGEYIIDASYKVPAMSRLQAFADAAIPTHDDYL
ncbi:hypothetical protein [Nitrospirillum viridazoti]|uniref:hypothetical protein n=1 Tax=Nitrospirillum viridazoti TaxID=3144925 RepID=UPI00119DEBB0|nr:hypothetical protein [Nitrospirillum amazonense]TWB40095.1 hypothetical protein FBZ91_105331 [Nitrospirillum amazonense]